MINRKTHVLKTNHKKIILFSFFNMVLTGCVLLGPDYEEPKPEVELAWQDIEDPRISEQTPADPKWWKYAFNDPVLDELIEIALRENLTLRSAGLRVLQSQQLLAIAIGEQYPQQQQITGLAGRGKEEGEILDNYNLGFSVTWELDFWGRFQRQIESASAALDASVASYDDVLVLLISQVAETYLLICTFNERVKVAYENIKLQEESLRIAKAKFDAGDVSELDADQAESILYNTKASVSSLETSLQQFKNSLAILLGKPPHDLNYILGKKLTIPSAPVNLGLGMPQDLIRRRPDIRVAERQLASQSAQIGFAVTELYPHLFIGGSIGTNATETGDLFESESEIWNIFGTFQWNIFNYGRLRSNVRLQDARFQQLLVDYFDTVLQAQADVENAIVAFLKSHEQLEYYRLAFDASKRALDVSSAQYENGLVSFNTVINTLNDHVVQQDLLTSTQGNVATNLVTVQLSLGGGWEIRNNQNPVDFLPVDMKEQMRERTKQWEGVLQ